jgi:transposase
METIKCKNCGYEKTVKNGKVRGQQRYKCKQCGYNFVLGDKRTNSKIASLKALVVRFYSLGKGFYNMLGKILKRHPSQIYRWVRQASLPRIV